jgi:hypothetical protein
LREHCLLAELEAYRRGTLPAARQDELAEHLAICEDCTILLLCAVPQPDEAESRGEALALGIDAAWNRLRPHLPERGPGGRTLASLLDRNRLPTAAALPLALAVARALASLHSAGRSHPDLRAENVLITDAGEVRLLERGFAPSPESLEIGYGRPAEAAVVDLYRSLSPEQIAGKEPDQRSNLFSLGAILYELLTGISPFRAQTPLETAGRISSLDPAPARDLDPGLPAGISELLERLLAKESEDRPAHAVTVVCALESALGSHGPAGPPPRTDEASLEDEIERLYDEILALVHEQTADGQPRDEEIERAYARLRELQAAEAREFRARFEASLAMPIDAGKQILERARALRAELEDLASADPAAREADGT